MEWMEDLKILIPKIMKNPAINVLRVMVPFCKCKESNSNITGAVLNCGQFYISVRADIEDYQFIISYTEL